MNGFACLHESCRALLFISAYTPSFMTPVFSLNTWPASGMVHGRPDVRLSGCVATQRSVAATRWMGSRGRPRMISCVAAFCVRDVAGQATQRGSGQLCGGGQRVDGHGRTDEPGVHRAHPDAARRADGLERVHHAQDAVLGRAVLHGGRRGDRLERRWRGVCGASGGRGATGWRATYR